MTKTCFVIMPISNPSGYEPNHFNIVYEHIIKPACEDAGFIPVRADEVNETNVIAIDILRKILDAEMAICDISSKNPNVMYELGLRHAARKPVTILKDNITEDIFDISSIRRIEYNSSLRIDQVKQSVADLKASIEETYANREGSANSLMSLIEHKSSNGNDQAESLSPGKNIDFGRDLLVGEVHHWDEDRSIGAIHDSEGTSYYVNLSHTVHSEALTKGEKVYFIPTVPPGEGKNPFSNCVMAVGREADGVVKFVNSSRGFAFAEVSDPKGTRTSIYISISNEQIVEGTSITFKIAENSEGVCGINPFPKD